MSPRLRLALLGAAFALTAWFAFFADAPELSTVSAVQARAGERTQPLTMPAAGLVAPQLIRRDSGTAADAAAPVDLFWPQHQAIATEPSPPPAPVPVAVAPIAEAPPQPPALPYRYLGKQRLEAGPWDIFLMRQEQVFLVREGDVLEGRYRVERVAPPQMSLRLVGSEQVQNLNIGESN